MNDMPLRFYGKWNYERFCKYYFAEFTKPTSTATIHPSNLCGKTNRCQDLHEMNSVIDEIRISMADCSIFLKRNKKLQQQYDAAVKTIRCALECFQKEPSMSSQEYVEYVAPISEPFLMPIRSTVKTSQ